MHDELESLRFLRGFRGVALEIARSLGPYWPAFAAEIWKLLGRIASLTTSEADRRRLVDELIALAISSPASAAARALLLASLERAATERGKVPLGLDDARKSQSATPGLPHEAATHAQISRVAEELVRNLEARYLNLCLADAIESHAILRSESLQPGTVYDLRVDIGPLSAESVVTHASESLFPALDFDPGEVGFWLDIVLVSQDFAVPEGIFSFFLPRTGRSWRCDCRALEGHVCRPSEREKFLRIAVATPARSGAARLRLAIYHRSRLLQSVLLTAQVGDEGPARTGYWADIDYNLTGRYTDLAEYTPRLASIFTNDNDDATHTLIIKGSDTEPFRLILTEGQMGEAVNASRSRLRATHFEESGGHLGAEVTRDNLLDKDNGKSSERFVEDLKALAPLGWKLFDTLLAGRDNRSKRLFMELFRPPGSILVGRKKRSQFVFPWALVYDLPLDPAVPDQFKLCPVLSSWPPTVPADQPFPTRCPREANHAPINTICPFGFWGVRHHLEQPPSQKEGSSVRRNVTAGRRPLQAVVGRALSLNASETQNHLTELATRLKDFHLIDCPSRKAIGDALKTPAPELVYFYCHGRSTSRKAGEVLEPELEVGSEELITPSGLLAWGSQADWPLDHWHDTAPLVFINGCHTVEITPAALASFVDEFADLEAAGVIGTEISVDQHMASEAGEQFLGHFADGRTVAESIRRMRGHFLGKGNCLGLAYTPYCGVDLCLVKQAPSAP